ncbi:MAG: hypothetical protein HYU77_13800 [Betaproteobacteria bacterium]|nr:hypothetical protein [Betaproteobacteria bacterium]
MIPELMPLAGAVGTLIAGAWALVKIVVGQFEKRLDERFRALESARTDAQKQWDSRFRVIEEGQREMERDVSRLREELPVHYVRREDAIRSETVINAKLDALAAKIDRLTTLQTNG